MIKAKRTVGYAILLDAAVAAIDGVCVQRGHPVDPGDPKREHLERVGFTPAGHDARAAAERPSLPGMSPARKKAGETMTEVNNGIDDAMSFPTKTPEADDDTEDTNCQNCQRLETLLTQIEEELKRRKIAAAQNAKTAIDVSAHASGALASFRGIVAEFREDDPVS